MADEMTCTMCDVQVADTLSTCAGCNAPICDNCTKYCDSCEKLLCKKDAIKCSDCGRPVCGDCLLTCGDCGDPLCPACAITCKWCDSPFCENCIKSCYQCEDYGCKHCFVTCTDCGRYYCPDCVEVCDLCEEHVCYSCLDDHDCDEIGEQEPDYSLLEGDDGKGYHYGLEIEVFGAHDQSSLKDSPLIAGWCSDRSLSYPGAGEYQSKPLPWSPVILEELAGLIRGIDPLNGDEFEAGGHIHVDRTPRQTALGWLEALAAVSHEQSSALNMRQFDDTRNEYCSMDDSFEGKHCAVNDDHWSTIELRVFGPWWRGTVDKLTPAMKWVNGMWEWFESHPKAGQDEIWEESRRVADTVLA